MTDKEQLISLLGLKSDATDEVISNASKSFQSDMILFKTTLEEENQVFQNRATEAETAKTTAEAQVTELKNTNKALTDELINSDVAAYKDVITNEIELREQLLSNRAGTLKILKGIKKVEKKAPDAPLHNSKNAANPGDPTGETTTEASEADARKIANRAKEIQRTSPSMGFQQAFIAARGELEKLSN